MCKKSQNIKNYVGKLFHHANNVIKITSYHGVYGAEKIMSIAHLVEKITVFKFVYSY